MSVKRLENYHRNLYKGRIRYIMKIKNSLLKFHNKISDLSTFKLIILMFLLIWLMGKLVFPLYRIFPAVPVHHKAMTDMTDISTLNNLISVTFRAGIMTPIVETLVAQTFVIRLTWIWTKIFFKEEGFWANFIPIIVSALIFGFTHLNSHNSYVKFLNTFLGGLILAYIYVVAYYSNRKASLCVMCVHSLQNIYTIAINYFVLYLT